MHFCPFYSEDMKRKEIGPYLKGHGFRSDPVKAWKASLASQQEEEAEQEAGSDQEEGQEVGVAEEGQDYDYLMSMPAWSFTRDEKERLLKKRDDKVSIT